jgi:glycosyl hydrolase family 25
MWRCLAGRRARARATVAAGCSLGALAAASGLGVSPAAAAVAVQGLDVSSHQISTDWASVASGGMRFAYIKATEGLRVSNARFTAQYNGAYAATPGRLPAGWSSYTFWQSSPGGPVTGNHDVFNGSSAELRNFAAGS